MIIHEKCCVETSKEASCDTLQHVLVGTYGCTVCWLFDTGQPTLAVKGSLAEIVTRSWSITNRNTQNQFWAQSSKVQAVPDLEIVCTPNALIDKFC
jgi:hypothetical protein